MGTKVERYKVTIAEVESRIESGEWSLMDVWNECRAGMVTQIKLVAAAAAVPSVTEQHAKDVVELAGVATNTKLSDASSNVVSWVAQVSTQQLVAIPWEGWPWFGPPDETNEPYDADEPDEPDEPY